MRRPHVTTGHLRGTGALGARPARRSTSRRWGWHRVRQAPGQVAGGRRRANAGERRPHGNKQSRHHTSYHTHSCPTAAPIRPSQLLWRKRNPDTQNRQHRPRLQAPHRLRCTKCRGQQQPTRTKGWDNAQCRLPQAQHTAAQQGTDSLLPALQAHPSTSGCGPRVPNRKREAEAALPHSNTRGSQYDWHGRSECHPTASNFAGHTAHRPEPRNRPYGPIAATSRPHQGPEDLKTAGSCRQ
jgi:hypothetical protein